MLRDLAAVPLACFEQSFIQSIVLMLHLSAGICAEAVMLISDMFAGMTNLGHPGKHPWSFLLRNDVFICHRGHDEPTMCNANPDFVGFLLEALQD